MVVVVAAAVVVVVMAFGSCIRVLLLESCHKAISALCLNSSMVDEIKDKANGFSSVL